MGFLLLRLGLFDGGSLLEHDSSDFFLDVFVESLLWEEVFDDVFEGVFAELVSVGALNFFLWLWIAL